MEVRVYQYQIQKNGKTYNRVLLPIGLVIGENVTPSNVWHLTNWSCWLSEDNGLIECDGCIYKPSPNDVGYTNHDIMFEIDGVFYTAESIGFAKFDTFNEAKEHLIKTNPIRIKRYI